MAKIVHQLLTGKASSWFWRFHKRTETFTWNQFCTGLHEQYKENRSKTGRREQIRARKQKPASQTIIRSLQI